MSFLEKIRKNTWILFFFIGISLLAFILDPDILFKFFTRNSNIVGKVNGENISIKEYVNCFQFLKRFRQGESDFYLKNEAWNLLIHEKLLNQQAIKLGLQITEKDFWNAISKQSIYSYIPEFQDYNGNLDMNKFQLYLKKLEKKSIVNNSQIEEEKNIWSYEKNHIPKRILAKKYIEMLMYGLNTSLVEAELNYKEKNSFSIVDYIFIPYSEIEHKYNISLGKSEIQDYVKKHKFLYKKEDLRSLSFSIIRSKPSLEDEMDMKNKMKELFQKFKYTNQNSIFVSNQSEKPFDSNFYLKKNLPIFFQNFVVQNNKNGSMFGPVKVGNTYVIAKIIGKKMISDSVLSSHILISHKNAIRSSNRRTEKTAEKIAKKIYNIVKKDPSKFDLLVQEKSDDTVNEKKNQGSLGWLKYEEQNSVGTFNIFNEENKKGAIGLTKTEFGYHILRIDKKSPTESAYQFAIIIKTLIPSRKTENSISNNVRKFLIENKNSNLNTFIKNSRKKEYETIFLKNIRSNQWEINDLNTEADREIINWSFEKKRKEGDIKIISNSNRDFIIVYLSKIQKRGFPIEKIKNNLTSFLIKKKIEKLFYNMVKRNSISGNLEKIAFSFSKKIKKHYKINFYDSMINNYKEPKVVGFSFSLKLKNTSKPIFGKNGIFFIRPLKHIFTSKKPSYFSYEIEVLNSFLRKKIIESLAKRLINKSNIKDYRKNI
ncbi:peptidylprolyl isomerase [Blattabacterium sp. (Cryptocercus kyebangensis)]|uniref:peptidylprolyl isomerase n=1 Tax=Blattabacterium sp. (Cryptocercus kyebangensis) TaxID=298656 RepID=UPI000D7C28A9|nr:peptidylprolyl isomerase [Blattabacterium sp. (Cryptocercus kyebangensis)]AWU43556.1 peptidylprolyl isomerase [Blattabacterium sp. (Cryptocercus kyebangensis)]